MRQRLHRLFARLGRLDALDRARRQRDVLQRRHVREQVVALEHDADVLAQRAQVQPVAVMQRVAADADGAGVGGLEPVHAAQRGALARAALADDGRDLAAIDGKRHAAQHVGAAEALVDLVQFNDGMH